MTKDATTLLEEALADLRSWCDRYGALPELADLAAEARALLGEEPPTDAAASEVDRWLRRWAAESATLSDLLEASHRKGEDR